MIVTDRNYLCLDNFNLESSRIINKRFENLYNNKNILIKYNYLLRNAFSPEPLTKKHLHRNLSNDVDMDFILRENRKSPSRFNIYNYKKILDPIKNNININKNDDKMLSKILFLFNKKKQIKDINLQKKVNYIKKNKLELKIPTIPASKLKILAKNNCSTNCSNNESKFIPSSNRNGNIILNNIESKFTPPSNRNKNMISNDNENTDFKNYFYPPLLKKNFFKIYLKVLKNEKILHKKITLLNKEIKKTKSHKNFLTNADKNIKNKFMQKFKSTGNLIENPEKFRNMESIEKNLFKENKQLFEQTKNNLYNLYKSKLKLLIFDDD